MKTDIEQALKMEIALKTIQSLPEEMKNEILAQGVMRELASIKLDWEVSKILRDEAMVFAHEYVNRPEIQEQLREKTHKAVDDVLDGIVKVIGRGIENDIKNNYTRILSDKTYGER